MHLRGACVDIRQPIYEELLVWLDRKDSLSCAIEEGEFAGERMEFARGQLCALDWCLEQVKKVMDRLESKQRCGNE